MNRKLLKVCASLAIAGLLAVPSAMLADNIGRLSQKTEKSFDAAAYKAAHRNPLKKVKGNRAETNQTGLFASGDISKLTNRAANRKSKTAGLITRSAENPRGHLFGSVGSFQDMQYFSEAFWGEINTKTGAVTKLYSGSEYINYNDYDLQGGFVRKNIFYTPVVHESIDGPVNITWNRVNIENGDVLQPLSFGADFTYYGYSMAYNPDDDLIYSLCVDMESGTANQMTIIEPETWMVLYTEPLMTNGEFVGGLAYNPVDKLIYLFGDFNTVYSFSPKSQKLNLAGTFETEVSPVEDRTTTQVIYSPLDASFVMVVRDYDQKCMRLIYVDPESWEVYDGVTLGDSNIRNPYFITLYCPDGYALPDAPEQPANPVVAISGADFTTASYSFTAPELNFAGVAFAAGTKLQCKLTIDGVEAFSGEMTPGQTLTQSYNYAQGLHTFVLTFANGDKVSPAVTSEIWFGFDHPDKVGNLTLEGNTLTWTAPGEIGQHYGHVDTADLTYNVYMDGVKLNTAPVTATTFTYAVPETLGKRELKVTAVSRGLESIGATLKEIVGKALTVPVSLEPTKAQSEIFTVLNANRDACQFIYDTEYGQPCFELWLDTNSSGNDWLFLPVTAFDSNSHLYNLSFEVGNAQSYYGSEDLAVYIGNAPKPSAMNTNIYKIEKLNSKNFKTQTTNFAVPAPGDWYIGFHCTSNGVDAGGVRLRNFNIVSLADVPSTVPGDPTDVTVKADPTGESAAIATLTLPTVDIVGNPLDANKEITVTIQCYEDKDTAKGKPGQTVTLNCPALFNGYQTFTITVSNEYGDGIKRFYTQYVGLDRPLAPRNIAGTASEDNLTVHVTWDKPEAVGHHGGYVDVDDLEYIFYTVEGVTYLEQGRTRGFDYSWTPTSRTSQYRYVLGPAATNYAGESYNSAFLDVVLGVPYTLPSKEEFSGTGYNFNPVFYNSAQRFADSTWDSVASVMGFKTGVKVDVNDSGIIVYNTGTRETQGELVLPKFNTTGIDNSFFCLRYLDWDHSPEFSVWATYYGGTGEVKVGEVIPERDGTAKWVDAEFVLPEELQNCGWVQFYIRAKLSKDIEEFGFIDAYTVGVDVDTDFKMHTISGATDAVVGDTHTFILTGLNSGRNAMAGKMIARLKDKDGNVLDRMDFNTGRVTPSRQFQQPYTVNIKAGYDAVAPLYVEATVELAGDEIEINNTLTHKVDITAPMLPAITDLTASWNDDRTSVSLSWSEPNAEYGGRDGFEYLKPFEVTENLGLWTNVDLDQTLNWTLTNGATPVKWPNWDKPQAWTVINADEIHTVGEPRMGGHSGKQYLLARSCEYDEKDETTMVQACDWLISPEVVGGSEVSFWYCAVSSDYDEYVEVYYSDTDDALGDFIVQPNGKENPVDGYCGSFKYLRTFSKSGEEAWEKVTFRLPDNAKYFAFVYRSWDSLGAMIDDVTFEQAKPAKWDIAHYNVYRYFDNDWNTLETVAEGVKANSHIDLTAQDRNATYFVTTHVNGPSGIIGGPRSNPASVYSSSVGEIGTSANAIVGGKGEISVRGMAGKVLAIHTLDGKLVKTLEVASDSERTAVEAGVYLATCGTIKTKVLVK